MKINKLYNTSKKEDEYMETFAKFYLSSHFRKIKEIDIDSPDKDNRHNFPDYFLKQPKISVEITEVHEREELEKSIAWDRNIKRLEEELKSRKLEFLKGSYLVDTPSLLRIKRNKEKEVIDEILKAIQNNNSIVSIKKIGEFKIVKYSNDGKSIVFSLGGDARAINPAGTIHQNIGPKIETANKQLGAIKADKKILLLVNKYIFGNRISEFIEALSYSYKELLTYKNIDEIWLQLESATGEFFHILIYERNFLNSFEKTKFKKITKDEIKLLEGWFYPLSKLGDEYKEKLFITLKQFLKDKKPHEIFDNEFAREEMARLGIWLAEKRDLVMSYGLLINL